MNKKNKWFVRIFAGTMVVLMVLGYMKRRKFNTQVQELRDNVKVGDKVMTDTGVVGEIVDVSTEGEHKYFTIKSGTAKNFGYIKVHANAVYYVFDKNEPKYATTEKDEDVEIVEAEEPVKEEKPVKTTRTTKKSTK